jgi:hypothetical protein
MSRTFFSLDREEKYFLAFQPPVREGKALGRAVDLAWFHLCCIVIE